MRIRRDRSFPSSLNGISIFLNSFVPSLGIGENVYKGVMEMKADADLKANKGATSRLTIPLTNQARIAIDGSSNAPASLGRCTGCFAQPDILLFPHNSPLFLCLLTYYLKTHMQKISTVTHTYICEIDIMYDATFRTAPIKDKHRLSF